MGIKWIEFIDSMKTTPEEEEIIFLEKLLVTSVISARENCGLTQKQLAELCGLKQSVIAMLESAMHLPQVNDFIRILKPLGYTLAVVKEDQLL